VTSRQTPEGVSTPSEQPIFAPDESAEIAFPIVAVGASAGGLEAFKELLKALPANSGMAFILVLHLDPNHKSMMPSLLAPHTRMPVREVVPDARIEADTVYAIGPGTSLAIQNGAFVVGQPSERHGARMPFDFLLRSLAESHGERTFGLVLSGNGSDGSLGLKAINERGGLVIAQDPNEAGYGSMPQHAIDLGIVDFVLPIDKIPQTLMSYAKQRGLLGPQDHTAPLSAVEPRLAQITDILRSRLAQDFTSYKPGTLMRRIARRMATRAIDDIELYVTLLRDDAEEADVLARDLLIHVTGFFRDPEVFKHLAAKVIPQLLRQHPADQPLRIWVPACSTGEEVYSLAMVFLEEIAATKSNVKLQIFGSDIDETAVAMARTGRYPAAIKTEISPAQLRRFFAEEAGGYRVGSSLREAVIFTVHDILTDPPFARIDFAACRNLLIYLLPDAQYRVLSLLHFALRKGGVLLLGTAESVSALRDDFEAISDDLRIFRRAGSGRKLKTPVSFRDQPRAFWPRAVQDSPQPPENIGEISERILLDLYAPASVLVDHRDQIQHYLGSTDKYLQIPSGDVNQGLYAVVRPPLRGKLRTALRRSRTERAAVISAAGIVQNNGLMMSVRIEIHPVQIVGADFSLVSFIDQPQPQAAINTALTDSPGEGLKVAELENTVESLQRELHETALELESSSADQAAINEEAQSLNEEFQSTNEELETSKEELQSLNEELTALNAQLSATVNQQRSTADDLENILRSSELAIVFLDLDLKIRFFSSAAQSLLRTIDSDIGRPIQDLAYRFDDDDLVLDIHFVLKSADAINREIHSHSGSWYTRRILPYRTQTGRVLGVVLLFDNISLTKVAEHKVEAARIYANSVIDTVRQPLVVVGEDLRVLSSNSSFRQAFASGEDILGADYFSIGGGRLDTLPMNHFIDRARAESAPIENYEMDIDLPAVGRRILLLSARSIPGESPDGKRLLIAIDDITERKDTSAGLEIAKLKAEKANLGKSRFLAAASHDLRQPLQTLSLLHGVLARQTTDAESLSLIGKLNETLAAMASMLDTLLDINQLEAGAVLPEIDNVPVQSVLNHLKAEFSYLAKAKGVSLRCVASSLSVRSDPLLLGQMLRNLISNALKYTKSGKVLFGCRRRGSKVLIEVWDTGIGIPSSQLEAIFEEYHQIGNPARERGLGLGLGLSIVHRIGELLGHYTTVRSQAGKGSVFTIDVPLASSEKQLKASPAPRTIDRTRAVDAPKKAGDSGTLLIVEDDPTVREALELLFKNEGYLMIAATDGVEAAALAERADFAPDVVIADYNLPGGRTGLEVIADLRRTVGKDIPSIILTGDIATDVLRTVVAADCQYLHKPVNVEQLIRRVADLVKTSRQPRKPSAVISANPASFDKDRLTVFIVDDDSVLLESMREMLHNRGHTVETHVSAESFLSAYRPERKGCLLIDSVMPGISGLELLRRLRTEGHELPSIVITGYGDITMAIKAMKVGAMDFIEKPAKLDLLVASIDRALAQAADSHKRTDEQMAAAAAIAGLTLRERQVMDLVVQGLPNKQIAFDLEISQRTVETHRAAVMKRTGSESLPDLIRLVMRAG